MRDDCDTTFIVFKKVFPLVLRLNCCFHFLGRNSCNWGKHLTDQMDAKRATEGASELQSISDHDNFNIALGNFV